MSATTKSYLFNDAAIEAHQEGKQVKVVGTMSGQGSGRKIDCNHFEELE